MGVAGLPDTACADETSTARPFTEISPLQNKLTAKAVPASKIRRAGRAEKLMVGLHLQKLQMAPHLLIPWPPAAASWCPPVAQIRMNRQGCRRSTPSP